MILNTLVVVTTATLLLIGSHVFGQCCAGGTSSPIAGGTSQGVLQDKQLEINTNLQYIHTTRFLDGSEVTDNFLDRFSSVYNYNRIAFGLSEKFSMSLELGYWVSKTQIGLNKRDTVSSKGIGDLVLFPRYNILNINNNGIQTDVTVGLGLKLPLGSFNDSTGHIEPFSGQTYYLTKPMVMQNSSGAHDFIFYSFFYRGYTAFNFSLFTNFIYIKKGWNPLGEKLGDYSRLGLFASKKVRKFSFTLQVAAEWVYKMKINKDIAMYTFLNYDPEATGSRKIFVVPQIGFSAFDNFHIYCLYEFPLYQHVAKTQIASQTQVSLGISYRINTLQQ
jgi:hypothetical protein